MLTRRRESLSNPTSTARTCCRLRTSKPPFVTRTTERHNCPATSTFRSRFEVIPDRVACVSSRCGSRRVLLHAGSQPDSTLAAIVISAVNPNTWASNPVSKDGETGPACGSTTRVTAALAHKPSGSAQSIAPRAMRPPSTTMGQAACHDRAPRAIRMARSLSCRVVRRNIRLARFTDPIRSDTSASNWSTTSGLVKVLRYGSYPVAMDSTRSGKDRKFSRCAPACVGGTMSALMAGHTASRSTRACSSVFPGFRRPAILSQRSPA